MFPSMLFVRIPEMDSVRLFTIRAKCGRIVRVYVYAIRANADE